MKPVTVSRFDGAMADDLRSRAGNECSICRHFDTYSSPFKLTPIGGIQADTTGQTKIGNLQVGSNGRLYGLGCDPSNPTLQSIFKKNSSTDPTASWTELALAHSGKLVNYNLFVEYKSYWYTAESTGNRYVGKYDINELAAVNPTYIDLTSYTTIGQGIVHPKDDILYIPYDNKICVNNNGSVTAVGLTLPSNRTITSISPYGNYLAIATVPTTAGAINQNSVVYLWDRDTSLATVTESIDFGNGTIKVLNQLNGILVAVMLSGGNSNYARHSNSLQVKVYTGGAPVTVKEITAYTVTLNTIVNFINSNRLYFAAKLDYSYGASQSASNTFPGVFAFYRNKAGGWGLSIERLATTDNSDYANFPLAAAVVKDYASIVYTDYGTLSITKSTATDFSTTSVYESLINPEMPDEDRHLKKQLRGFSVQCSQLSGTKQIVVKYRTDAAMTDSWTTLFTKTASSPDTDLMGYSVDIPVSTGAFTIGREFQFRLESTNGAEIIGFTYLYEPLTSSV